MSHGHQSSYAHHERPRWQWWAIGGAIAAAYALGAFGFWSYNVARTGHGHGLDAMYHALQLFALHAPALEPPVPLTLEFARWLAVGLLGLAATTTASRVFRGEIDTIRAGRLTGHVVICGDGRIVLDMVRSQSRARSFREWLRSLFGGRRRQHVLVIASAEQTELIESCRALHASVLVGRPSALLASARLSHAKRLIAVHEEDSANVEIAVVACGLARASRPTGSDPLLCHVQISNVDLREDLRHHRFLDEHGRCRVRFFDVFEDAARDLLLNHLSLDQTGVSERDPRDVHLVIIGCGSMGRTMAVKAAQLGHFANRRPLRISVIDKKAAERQEDLRFRYPSLERVCTLAFHECAVQSTRARSLIEGWCAEDALTSVVICLDNDAMALDVAMQLSTMLREQAIPMAVRLSRPDGFASLLTHDAAAGKSRQSLRPFGWFDRACVDRLLNEDAREQMAKVVQLNFVALATSRGRQKALDDAVKQWDDLVNEDYKESNRQQIDHLAIKLRAVGRELAWNDDARPEAALTAAEVEVLAEMEHARWVGERLLAGWTYAAAPKDERKRTNPSLVPWAQLSDDVRHYDRDAVARIPAVVATQNRKICAAPIRQATV